MKDAYSFDIDEAGLDASYEAYRKAYVRIFQRCGLEAFGVDADPGDIGGSGSMEFMVAADAGEDAILIEEGGDYAANVEKASSRIEPSRGPPLSSVVWGALLASRMSTAASTTAASAEEQELAVADGYSAMSTETLRDALRVGDATAGTTASSASRKAPLLPPCSAQHWSAKRRRHCRHRQGSSSSFAASTHRCRPMCTGTASSGH